MEKREPRFDEIFATTFANVFVSMFPENVRRQCHDKLCKQKRQVRDNNKISISAPPPLPSAIMHRNNSVVVATCSLQFFNPSLEIVTRRNEAENHNGRSRVASIYVIVTFPVERSGVPRKKISRGRRKSGWKSILSLLYEADISPRGFLSV